MRNLILLSVLFVSMFSTAQIATTNSGYTLRSFDDAQSNSYLLLEYGPQSDRYCLDGVIEKRVEVIGDVYTNGGAITRRLEIDGERYSFVHQSYGDRMEDVIEGTFDVSNGVRDVSKFYMIVDGEPTLIDDLDWALCYQTDYRRAEMTVNGVSYFGTTYDGNGRVNGVDQLPIGLSDRSNNRHFRWINMENYNKYRLQLIVTSTRADVQGSYIDVIYDPATGGVNRIITYRADRADSPIDDVAIPRSYNSYLYVNALKSRARKLY